MQRREKTIGSATVAADRKAEVADVVDRVTRWAAARQDVAGLLLVGSYAREDARPDSDVDLMLIVDDPALYSGDTWAADLGLGELTRTHQWGAIREWRFVTSSDLEVEVNIGSRQWASTDPVDPGTRHVVRDGAHPLHDPAGLLARLQAVCGNHNS